MLEVSSRGASGSVMSNTSSESVLVVVVERAEHVDNDLCIFC